MNEVQRRVYFILTKMLNTRHLLDINYRCDLLKLYIDYNPENYRFMDFREQICAAWNGGGISCASAHVRPRRIMVLQKKV